MKLLRMTATFGCLDGAVLELTQGLNLLTLPNESGKSTWAAFLLAMFYGIDTTRRVSREYLPDKLRYEPWSGKPMSGTVELEHGGRQIVLQRTSQRSRPMSVFQAYDKQMGLALPELTGENCGMYFFGVEREVLRRSALICGGELAVTGDRELARRLENLAASGDMAGSYPAAAGRLKRWKNHCCYHQSGLLPEAAARLAAAQERLEQLNALMQQSAEIAAAQSACKLELEQLEQAERDAWQQRRDAARRKYRAALMQLEQTEETAVQAACRRLPDSLLMELRDCLRALETHPLPPEPECPPELAGLDADSLLTQAHMLQIRQLRRETRENAVGIGSLCLAAAAALLGRRFTLLGAALLVPAGVGVLLWLYWYGRRKRKRPVDWMAAATARWSWLNAKAQQTQNRLHLEQLLSRAEELDQTLEPQQLTAAAVEQILTGGRDAEHALSQAELEYQAASAPLVPSPELLEKRAEAARLAAEMQRLAGQAAAAGGLAQAESQVQNCRRELEQLEMREQALLLAQEALEAAHSQLEQVYAPQVTQLAGQYLSSLTRGRYDGLVLEKDWQLQLRQRESGLLHPLRTLSSGTQDQVWLALRLAMARLLLPEDAPLILDDALLTFDEERTAAALALLRKENRQILLMSCRALIKTIEN